MQARTIGTFRGLLAVTAVLASALAGCGSGNTAKAPTSSEHPPPPLPTDTSGFTTLTPSADTVTIYVSSSTGNDSNDGTSPETAVATVQKGLSLVRDGSPDWLLFKRGDAWTTGFGGWKLSGRSPDERMVIGAYGDGERPRFEFKGRAITTTGAGGTPESMDNLVFTSLHFLGVEHDPSRGTPSGDTPACVYWLRGSRNTLFEDNRFEFCTIILQDADGFPIEGMTFRRNLMLDSYSLTTEHAQCLYASGVKRFTVEENIMDRCGFYPNLGKPTIFNHCVYWQEGGTPDGILRKNLILRCSSHGAQMRSSGTVEGNVFAQAAIGGFLASEWLNPPSGEFNGQTIGNLFTEGVDITPKGGFSGDESRGWGWDFSPDAPITKVNISDNIFSHCTSTGADSCKTVSSSNPDSKIENNIVHDWPSKGNQVGESPGPFVDPDRTLASYNASLGGSSTFDAFATEVRKQSKTNWRTAYDADAIIEYFREGLSPAN